MVAFALSRLAVNIHSVLDARNLDKNTKGFLSK